MSGPRPRASYTDLAPRHARCDHCDAIFKPTIGQLQPPPGTGRYCSRRCRRTAQTQNTHLCAACGDPRQSTGRFYGILPICTPCRDAAWRTCWRKIVHWRQPAVIHHDGDTLHPYRCVLCHGWHHTKLPPHHAPDPGLAARQAALAALFRSRGFNIDVYRHREHEEYPQ